MAEEGVVVEVELRVEGEHIAALGDDQGVDLDHGTIAGDEEAVEAGEEFAGRPHLGGGKSELTGELARLVGLKTEQRIDRLRAQFFRACRPPPLRFQRRPAVLATITGAEMARSISDRKVKLAFDLDGGGRPALC